MKKTSKIAISASAMVMALLLTGYSFYTAWNYGQVWLIEKAHEGWHMNNYTIVPAWVAYAVFGVLSLWVGGLLLGSGLAGGMFYVLFKKKWKVAFALIIAACCLIALGFNTMDYACGWFYWNDGNPSPIPFSFIVFDVLIDAWNFYFFCVVLPLAFSGAVLSFSLLWFLKLQ